MAPREHGGPPPPFQKGYLRPRRSRPGRGPLSWLTASRRAPCWCTALFRPFLSQTRGRFGCFRFAPRPAGRAMGTLQGARPRVEIPRAPSERGPRFQGTMNAELCRVAKSQQVTKRSIRHRPARGSASGPRTSGARRTGNGRAGAGADTSLVGAEKKACEGQTPNCCCPPERQESVWDFFLHISNSLLETYMVL